LTHPPSAKNADLMTTEISQNLHIADALCYHQRLPQTAKTKKAGVAQLVEQLICNHQVVSSSLITGSSLFSSLQ
jgi:hypothetical protein